MLLRADETTESELKVDTFLARDNYGDQLHFSVFHDDRALTSQVGVTALAAFLDNHINGRAPSSGSCYDVDGQLTATALPAGTQVTV